MGSVSRGAGVGRRKGRDAAGREVREIARAVEAVSASFHFVTPSVETRPVSGPSFAGNRAYLPKREAAGSRRGDERRKLSDRPTRTMRWRFMYPMPERTSAYAPPAFAAGTVRRVEGRAGL